MEIELNSLIQNVISNNDIHARWLNTFSYLEYIGFRKIVKSQPAGTLSVEVLAHAVEEGRHALRLRKLAVKIGGPQFDSYAKESTICLEEAAGYFRDLESAVENDVQELDQSRLTYLYVTWLVEKRALSVYEGYLAQAKNYVSPLRSLIAEEENHLRAVEMKLQRSDSAFELRSERLKKFEQRFYERFTIALDSVLRG